MQNIILSTAAFCLWNIKPEEKLRICKQLHFSDIEVALSTEKMVCDFLAFLEGSTEFLSFRKIALHAPWRGVLYGNNRQTRRILHALHLISEKIPAAPLIFHADRVEAIEPLIQSGLPICLENSEWDGCWDRLKGFFDNHELCLALNINRATRREDYLDQIIDVLEPRISRVYISGYDGLNGRMPMVSANQLQYLDKIQGLNAPLVLEGLFPPGDTASILQERQAVLQRIHSFVREEAG